MAERSQSDTSNRGFAAMDEDKQREIAKKGGESVPAEKRTFSRDPELAAEAGFLIKLITAVEHIVIGLFGVFADHFHGKSFVGVVALDTRADCAQQRDEARSELVHATSPDDKADVLIGHIQQAHK